MEWEAGKNALKNIFDKTSSKLIREPQNHGIINQDPWDILKSGSVRSIIQFSDAPISYIPPRINKSINQKIQ